MLVTNSLDFLSGVSLLFFRVGADDGVGVCSVTAPVFLLSFIALI